jgi:hypothetical protein
VESKPALWEAGDGPIGGYREALKSALYDTREQPAVTPELVLVIRQFCSDSQTRGQRPERSLVEFKLSLTEAANAIKFPLGPDRNKLLAGLVSTFIEELYRPATTTNAKLRAFDCGDAPRAAS